MLDLILAAENSSSNHLLWAFLLAMMVYLVVMGSGARKERKQFQQMLANLKKNDRVLTAGGIIGSVVSTTPEEVVLKVDESANVKITVVRSAIKAVLSEDPKARPAA